MEPSERFWGALGRCLGGQNFLGFYLHESTLLYSLGKQTLSNTLGFLLQFPRLRDRGTRPKAVAFSVAATCVRSPSALQPQGFLAERMHRRHLPVPRGSHSDSTSSRITSGGGRGLRESPMAVLDAPDAAALCLCWAPRSLALVHRTPASWAPSADTSHRCLPPSSRRHQSPTRVLGTALQL